MKKRVIAIAVISIVLILAIIILKINIPIKKITGDVTTQTVSMNITVVDAAPTLTLYSPKNNTYLRGTNILINYTTNAQNVWYQLDNQPNQSITGPTHFNTGNGDHSLYLYGNNTVGTVSQNVSFAVNNTRLTISYSKYNGTSKGSSTEFLNYTYEELQNLNNIILENENFGKISFSEAINLTADSDFSDNQVDIDSYIDISTNRIKVNTTELPNFNKAATLTLYNLTFTNPRILKDGEVCPDSICTIQSYSGVTLIFSVTEFSVYSAEETPEGETIPQLASEGGGTKKNQKTNQTSQTIPGNGTECTLPYIKNNDGCCLDQNNNNICDFNEKEMSKTNTPFSYFRLWLAILMLVSVSTITLIRNKNLSKTDKRSILLFALIFIVIVTYLFATNGNLKSSVIQGQTISVSEEENNKISPTFIILIFSVIGIIIILTLYYKIKKSKLKNKFKNSKSRFVH